MSPRLLRSAFRPFCPSAPRLFESAPPPRLRRRAARVCAVLATGASTGCFGALSDVKAQHDLDKAVLAQAEANARANVADATAHPLTFAPMETVPFSEAPKPPGGPGWYCFETRRRQGRDITTSSVCDRTLASCRRAAEQQARTVGGSARDPAVHDVGTCAKQEAAYCMYVWAPEGGAGGHSCHAVEKDCVPFGMGAPGGATKQSACGRSD